MASLFYLPWAIVRDVAGIGIPGAQVYFTQTSTNTKKSVYQDSGLVTPHTNPIICDGVGNPPITYLDPTVSYRVRVYDRDSEAGVDTPIKDIDPYVPGIFADATALQPVADDAANSASAATSSAAVAAAAATEAEASVAAANDLSVRAQAAVTTLTAALGPSVLTITQLLNSGIPADPAWFGITTNAPTADEANSDFLDTMMGALADRALVIQTNYQGLGRIAWGNGVYYWARTHDQKLGTTINEGTNGGIGTAIGTLWRWPSGVDGVIIQTADSAGESGAAGASHPMGAGSIYRGIGFQGAFADSLAESETHGVVLRGPAVFQDCQFLDWEGDGVHAAATSGSGTIHGNANGFLIERSSMFRNRNGLACSGADVNVYGLNACTVSANRQAGLLENDNASLGGVVFECLFDTNGITAQGGYFSFTSHSGNWFAVKPGQGTWCATNAPPVTQTDNTGWKFVSAGAPDPGHPAYASGMSWRQGGNAISTSVNASTCYLETYVEETNHHWVDSPSYIRGGGMGGKGNLGSGTVEQSTSLGRQVRGNLLIEGEANRFGRTSSFGGVPALELATADSFFQLLFRHYTNGVADRGLGSVFAYDTGGAGGDGFIVCGNAIIGLRIGGTEIGTSALAMLLTSTGVDLSTGFPLKYNGQQVVGARGASLPTDATDLATALTLVNAIKARLKATGGHGLVAD